MVEPLMVAASSGDEHVDEITAGVISLFELVFPQRIRGYYFEGSCADGGLTSLSDIDLTIVFIDTQTDGEYHQFDTLRGACKRISPRSVDLSCMDETTLLHANQLRFQEDWAPVLGAISLKFASRLAYGADIRPTLPLVPHAVYRRTMMHFPYLVLIAQRKHRPHRSYPFDYPDPTDQFFGYTARRLRGPAGVPTPSTKRLVHASAFIATALLALHTTMYVADKRTAVTRYGQYIKDGWAEHLEAIHQYCRVQWDYHVPQAPEDRAILRQLCEQQLAFENYFLAIYKDYLEQEQTSEDAYARQVAKERLQYLTA